MPTILDNYKSLACIIEVNWTCIEYLRVDVTLNVEGLSLDDVLRISYAAYSPGPIGIEEVIK